MSGINMNDLVDELYERIGQHLVDTAQENPIRNEYVAIMSNNNWSNQDFLSLVDHATKMVELNLERCRSDRDLDDLLNYATEQSVLQDISAWIMSDQQLQMNIPRNVLQEAERTAGEYQQLEREYTRFQQSQQRQRFSAGGSSGFGSGFRQQNRFSSGGSFRQQPRQMGGALAGGFGNRPAQQRSTVQSVNNGTTFRRQTGLFGGGQQTPARQGMAANPVNSGFANRRQQQPAAQAPQRTQPTVQRAAPVINTPTPPVETRPARNPVERNLGVREPVEADTLDLNKERPYDDFWLKGEHWQAACLSKWQWTWTPKQQYQRYFDPMKEMKFYVKSEDGKIVREEFLPMNDDMEYLIHETRARIDRYDRPAPTPRYTRRAPAGDVDLSDINIPLAETVEDTTPAKPIDVNSIEVRDKALGTSSLAEARIMLGREGRRSGKDIYIRSGLLTMPFATEDGDALTVLNQTATMEELQIRLSNLRGHVTPDVLQFIDQYYTDVINRQLKLCYGFAGLSIDSFMDDYQDLVKVITKRRSSGFAEIFATRVRPLLQALNVVDDHEGKRTYLESIIGDDSVEDSVTDEEVSNTVLIVINYTFVQLDLNVAGRTVPRDVALTLTPGTDEELFKIAGTLYSKARAMNTGRIYLQSADNQLLELVAIQGAKDVLGLLKI